MDWLALQVRLQARALCPWTILDSRLIRRARCAACSATPYCPTSALGSRGSDIMLRAPAFVEANLTFAGCLKEVEGIMAIGAQNGNGEISHGP